MTHEVQRGDEPGGPERFDALPNAEDVPTYEDPVDSDLPPLTQDIESGENH